MGAVVYFDQLFHRYLSIDLCCGEASVTEEFLNVAEVCAAVEQMRSERVPQAMRRNVVDVGALGYVFVDHPTYGTRSDASSAAVQEDGLFVALSGRAFI